jgi:putative FmdB family regulatory protein
MDTIFAAILYLIMPTYSYSCSECKNDFELFFYIKDYVAQPKCVECRSNNTYRRYNDDILTQSCSVKKADNELKTLGDLAARNTERMSVDQKQSLYEKHNSYKEEISDKPLPKGMNRIKKPPKTEWT